MPTTTRPLYMAMPTSGHPLSFFQCRKYFPYFDNFLYDIGVKFRSRSLFVSISFAPYRRAPFTPTFADGGVQRSLAPALALFPLYGSSMAQSHLTPITPEPPHTDHTTMVIGRRHDTTTPRQKDQRHRSSPCHHSSMVSLLMVLLRFDIRRSLSLLR